jgi:hypothetical protein
MRGAVDNDAKEKWRDAATTASSFFCVPSATIFWVGPFPFRSPAPPDATYAPQKFSRLGLNRSKTVIFE